MAEVKKVSGLSPERIEQIKIIQQKKSIIDSGCDKLTPEEFINWHPVNGISWEERAKLMKEAGITEPNQIPVIAIPVAKW